MWFTSITVLALLLSRLELSRSFLQPSHVSFERSKAYRPHPSSQVLRRAHDILVTLPGGEKQMVVVDDGQTILEALETKDIDAPHSCRSGLCTE